MLGCYARLLKHLLHLIHIKCTLAILGLTQKFPMHVPSLAKELLGSCPGWTYLTFVTMELEDEHDASEATDAFGCIYQKNHQNASNWKLEAKGHYNKDRASPLSHLLVPPRNPFGKDQEFGSLSVRKLTKCGLVRMYDCQPNSLNHLLGAFIACI